MEKSILNRIVLLITFFTFIYYGFSYYIISRHLREYGFETHDIIVFEDILFLTSEAIFSLFSIILVMLLILVHIDLRKAILKNGYRLNEKIKDFFKNIEFNLADILSLVVILLIIVVFITYELDLLDYLLIGVPLLFFYILYAFHPNEFFFMIILGILVTFCYLIIQKAMDKVYVEQYDKNEYFCDIKEYIIYYKDTSYTTSNIIFPGYRYYIFEIDSNKYRKIPSSSIAVDIIFNRK